MQYDTKQLRRLGYSDAADEIETLRRKCEDQTMALVHACELGQGGLMPSNQSLNIWRLALGWEGLPEDFTP